MKSRTIQTCENILRSLIQKYGPTAQVGQTLVDKAIIECAGGDSRTLKRFREQLVLLDFLRVSKNDTFTFNVTKVDFKQLMLQDVLMISDDEPP